MDKLARTGVVFREHYSADTATRESVPKIFASRYFAPALFPYSSRIPYATPKGLVHQNDGGAITLPRLFARNGYRTIMFNANAALGTHTEFARSFDEVHDIRKEGGDVAGADLVIDEVLVWLDKNERKDALIYIHLMDTHFPHRPTSDALAFRPDGLAPRVRNKFSAGGAPLNKKHELPPDERAYLDAIVDGSLRSTDRELGRLFDELGDDLDETLILITSDHGDNLLHVSDRWNDGGPWFEAVGRAPLLVHYPKRLQPAQVQSFTSSVDVLPTLADAANLETGVATFDGFSALGLLDGTTEPRTAITGQRGVRVGDVKCLFHDRNGSLLTPEPPSVTELRGQLYDLASDPAERNDLWKQRPADVQQCLDAYRSTLLAPYREFLATRREAQPASGFALGIEHAVVSDHVVLDAVGAPSPNDKNSWHLAGQQGGTLWTDGRKPVEFSYELPNGQYSISLAMTGSARVDINGKGPTLLEGPRGQDTDLAYGVVDVIDRVVRITVAPDSSVSISRVGFEPAAQTEPQMSEETMRLLGTLGYID